MPTDATNPTPATITATRSAAAAAHDVILRLAESTPTLDRVFGVHREAVEAAVRFFEDHVLPFDRPGCDDELREAQSLAEPLQVLADLTAPVRALSPIVVADGESPIEPVLSVRWEPWVGPVVNAVLGRAMVEGEDSQSFGYDAAGVTAAVASPTLYRIRAEIRARAAQDDERRLAEPILGEFSGALHARHLAEAASWLSEIRAVDEPEASPVDLAEALPSTETLLAGLDREAEHALAAAGIEGPGSESAAGSGAPSAGSVVGS